MFLDVIGLSGALPRLVVSHVPVVSQSIVLRACTYNVSSRTVLSLAVSFSRLSNNSCNCMFLAVYAEAQMASSVCASWYGPRTR
jgi:hypothetical protein